MKAGGPEFTFQCLHKSQAWPCVPATLELGTKSGRSWELVCQPAWPERNASGSGRDFVFQRNVDYDRGDTWYILLASTCLHMVHTHAHTYHTIHTPCMVFNFVSILLLLTLWLCWLSNCIFELLVFCSIPVTGKSISHNQILLQCILNHKCCGILETGSMAECLFNIREDLGSISWYHQQDERKQNKCFNAQKMENA